METTICQSICECGQRYYYIWGACYLEDVNSQVARDWHSWAMQFNKPLCDKVKCKARKSTKGCISIKGLEGKEKEFVKYLETASRSKWQSKQRKSAIGITTKEQFNKIAILQNFECYYCLADLKSHDLWFDPSERGNIANWDHLQPISRKGSNWPTNMALTCQSCNAEKSNMTEQEYWKYLESVEPKSLVAKAKALRQSQLEEKRLIEKS